MTDYLEIPLAIIGCFLAAFLLIAIVTVCLLPFFHYNCTTYGKTTGHQVKYNNLTLDCYVKTDSGWFPRDQINQNNFKGQE